MSGPLASPISGPVDQGRGVLLFLGEVTPALKQRGHVSSDALGRKLLQLALDVAVVQIVEDPASDLVIRRPLAFPDSKVIAHARRLSCRSDSHKKRRLM